MLSSPLALSQTPQPTGMLLKLVRFLKSLTLSASPNPRNPRISLRVKPDHATCAQPDSLLSVPRCKHRTVWFRSHTDTRGDDSLEERLGHCLPTRSSIWYCRGRTGAMDTVQSIGAAGRQSRLLRSLAGRQLGLDSRPSDIPFRVQHRPSNLPLRTGLPRAET